jgi:hypothetical protein
MFFFAHLASSSSPLTSIVKHGYQASNSACQGDHRGPNGIHAPLIRDPCAEHG